MYVSGLHGEGLHRGLPVDVRMMGRRYTPSSDRKGFATGRSVSTLPLPPTSRRPTKTHRIPDDYIAIPAIIALILDVIWLTCHALMGGI